MNLLVKEDGTTIPAKAWINIEYRLIMADTPLGKDYHLIALETQQDVAQLLRKYDNTLELKIYFFKNILYITFDNERYHYTIPMNDSEFETLRKQIQSENRILFALLSENNELEYYYSYNII